MANASPVPPQPLQPQAPFTHPNPVEPEENELTIISHSNLFYWWPVWVMCFILGGLTWFDGHWAAIVPNGWKIQEPGTLSYTVPPDKGPALVESPALVIPKGHELRPPHIHMSTNKSYGVLFTFTLLVVIFITNVPMRGMWSLIVILVMAFLIVLAAYFEIWDWLFNLLTLLDIRLNEGGYFMIGLSLLGLWLLTFFVFDRRVYIKVTPGNFKVCTEVGGGEEAFDTAGIRVNKKPSDLFRHWILGFGAGDLTVKTFGATQDHYDLMNVLFIGRKLQQIENLTKKKSVVETR